MLTISPFSMTLPWLSAFFSSKAVYTHRLKSQIVRAFYEKIYLLLHYPYFPFLRDKHFQLFKLIPNITVS